MSNVKEIKFFLGSNTKKGFVPLFDELRDPIKGKKLYILKGGPGTGKSTLMKRIGKAIINKGHNVEYIPCASDPESLDAIIDYDSKITLVDGTAPHTLDPKFPGAYDSIINLGEAWNEKILLKNKKKIMELTNKISNYHSSATSSIAAAANLLDDNRNIASNYVNINTIDSLAKKFKNEFKDVDTGKERKRLLSAISVGKTAFLKDTITTICKKLYIIPDSWGSASNLLLSNLRTMALSMNLDFITCYCSIHSLDKIDHLLFPSTGLGIITANTFHSIGSQNNVLVDTLISPINGIELGIMTNNLSIAQNLITIANNHVDKAKKLHDELEEFYIEAMDFSKIDVIYDNLIKNILNS